MICWLRYKRVWEVHVPFLEAFFLNHLWWLLTQIFVYPSATQETLANAYDNGYLKERTMNNTFFFSGEKLLKFTLVFFDFLKFLSA